MKIFYPISFLSLVTLISVYADTSTQTPRPSMEQLSKMPTCKISFELFCDDEHCNSECWQRIETEIKALVDKCAHCPEGKSDEMFQEVYNVIDRIRKERRTTESQGIYGMLNVSCGQPPVDQDMSQQQ